MLAFFTLEGNQVKLTIFATTDVHGAIYPYNYFDNEDKTTSLLHAASYIKEYQARHKEDVVLTIDNGDFLQGDTWNDYDAEHPDLALAPTVVNEIYDVVGLGNHEFNFGFDYLSQVLSKYKAPIINSNISFKNSLKDVVKPHHIVKKNVNGRVLKIGFVSVVPTQITKWDHVHFRSDASIVSPMLESLKKEVQHVRDQGADVVIALAHTGLKVDVDPYDVHGENQAYLFAQISEELQIDGIVSGHTHEVFPSDALDLRHDITDGVINNVAVVQPGVSAKQLGQLDFELEFRENSWEIKKRSAKVLEVDKMQLDQELLGKFKPYHKDVKAYLTEPITTLKEDWHTYFAQVLPSPAVQVSGEAAKVYAEKLIEDGIIPNLPVLSFNAPTRAGRDGAHDYTQILAGPLTLSDAINLYKHANTIAILKISGKRLREWLEWSASQFLTHGEPSLLDSNDSKTGFPSYNFDMFYDLEYTVDITNEPRYNSSGAQISENRRLLSATYRGERIKETDVFLVAANNYRASNTPLLQTPDVEVVYESHVLVRDLLIDYLKSGRTFTKASPLTVLPSKKYTFVSATKAQQFIKDEPIRHIKDLGNGFSVYEVDYGNYKK